MDEKEKYREFQERHPYGGHTRLETELYARGIDVIDGTEEDLKRALIGRANDERSFKMILNYLTAKVFPGYIDQRGMIFSTEFEGPCQTRIQYMTFLEGTKDNSDEWLNLGEACRSVNNRRKLLRALIKTEELKSIVLVNRKEIVLALRDYKKAEECARPENVKRVQETLRYYEKLRSEQEEDKHDRNYGGGPW